MSNNRLKSELREDINSNKKRLSTLSNNFGISYSKIPDLKFLQNYLERYKSIISPLLGKIITSGKHTNYEHMQFASEIAGKYTLTSYFCVGVGIERGKKTLNITYVPQMLKIIDDCLIYEIGLIVGLAHSYGQISINETKLYKAKISNEISILSAGLENFGFLFSSQVNLLNTINGKTPFLRCLIEMYNNN
ncbi:MAG TPA: hypothetical protein DCW42_09075 [Bacteroidetes bacterium]|nr:hypothetical protein [Bacteroidota bacterium]